MNHENYVSKRSSRLDAYPRISTHASAFGIAAIAVTGAADAAHQTWTVGQNFGYNNTAGTNGADLALSATFNTAFKVNFFNTGTVNQTNQETTANTAASYTPVPGPMGLTALALGAAGVRRSRKRSA